MLRKVASKVAWVGRTVSMVFGLALVLALMFGLASMAFAANGGNFILGQNNTASLLTKLTGQVPGGAALQVVNTRTKAGSRGLQVNVAAGKPPILVGANSGKATNLNADKLDGKNSTQIGVNGLQRVSAVSANNSVSPKGALVHCPSGKVPVGTGYDIGGGKSGFSPNALTDVVVEHVSASSTSVQVTAYEEAATNANWRVEAYAICAKAP